MPPSLPGHYTAVKVHKELYVTFLEELHHVVAGTSLIIAECYVTGCRPAFRKGIHDGYTVSRRAEYRHVVVRVAEGYGVHDRDIEVAVEPCQS